MSGLARHDMALLDARGLILARTAARAYNPHLSSEQIDLLIRPDVPGIVRRQEMPLPGEIELGFSSYFKEDGVRLRAATAVPLEQIERIITPFDAMALVSRASEPIRTLLDALCRIGSECGVEVGIYGSLALQLVSGLPYFTDRSDYDLFVRRAAADADIDGFYTQSEHLAARDDVRLDIEFDCGSGFGAKLKELFSGQKTVLCKGLYAAELRQLDTMDILCPGGET